MYSEEIKKMIVLIAADCRSQGALAGVEGRFRLSLELIPAGEEFNAGAAA